MAPWKKDFFFHRCFSLHREFWTSDLRAGAIRNTHTHTHTHTHIPREHLVFSILPKDTLPYRLEGPGIELLTLWQVDDQLCVSSWPQEQSVLTCSLCPCSEKREENRWRTDVHTESTCPTWQIQKNIKIVRYSTNALLPAFLSLLRNNKQTTHILTFSSTLNPKPTSSLWGGKSSESAHK